MHTDTHRYVRPKFYAEIPYYRNVLCNRVLIMNEGPCIRNTTLCTSVSEIAV